MPVPDVDALMLYLVTYVAIPPETRADLLVALGELKQAREAITCVETLAEEWNRKTFCEVDGGEIGDGILDALKGPQDA